MVVVFIKKKTVDFCSIGTTFTYELLLGVVEWGLVLIFVAGLCIVCSCGQAI